MKILFIHASAGAGHLKAAEALYNGMKNLPEHEATFVDAFCDQVVVHTDQTDPSGLFYGRFFNTSHLELGVLDDNIGSQSDRLVLAGMILETASVINLPPVASSPSPRHTKSKPGFSRTSSGENVG